MRGARIELSGIGPFDEASAEIPESEGPGELVLFEGPNGSGKTTLMEVQHKRPTRWAALFKRLGSQGARLPAG